MVHPVCGHICIGWKSCYSQYSASSEAVLQFKVQYICGIIIPNESYWTLTQRFILFACIYIQANFFILLMQFNILPILQRDSMPGLPLCCLLPLFLYARCTLSLWLPKLKNWSTIIPIIYVLRYAKMILLDLSLKEVPYDCDFVTTNKNNCFRWMDWYIFQWPLVFTNRIFLQCLFGILMVAYLPSLDSYPGYTPIRSELLVDNTDYEPLPGGEQICPERQANIFSSKI